MIIFEIIAYLLKRFMCLCNRHEMVPDNYGLHGTDVYHCTEKKCLWCNHRTDWEGNKK